jgi:hypothetical protein
VLGAPFPATGNAYIDIVLVPLAVSRGADSVFFAQLDTTVPGAVVATVAGTPTRAATGNTL